MDDVVEFPRARTKPLSEEEALERLRQAGRIEGIGAFAKLVDWERTGASRVVGQWERDGKVVRTPRPGYPTVIEAVVAGVPAVHTPIAPPVHHNPAQPAQPATWWRRVVRRRAQPVGQPAHPVPHPAWRFLVAAVLFLAAIDLAGSGLVMNARYAASLGSGEGATIRALLHLSYSYAPPCGPAMLVTHGPTLTTWSLPQLVSYLGYTGRAPTLEARRHGSEQPQC